MVICFFSPKVDLLCIIMKLIAISTNVATFMYSTYKIEGRSETQLLSLDNPKWKLQTFLLPQELNKSVCCVLVMAGVPSSMIVSSSSVSLVDAAHTWLGGGTRFEPNHPVIPHPHLILIFKFWYLSVCLQESSYRCHDIPLTSQDE